jgi:hypothetical protein
MYLNNIQDLDQVDNTFYADFFLWMRWRGEQNPTRTFEFTKSATVDKDHRYATHFGETGSGATKRTYSAATFDLKIKRAVTFFGWKLLLPLIIVVLLGGSVLLVHPSLIEVRIAAPATALLSMVFLQQGYSDTLPQIGSLRRATPRRCGWTAASRSGRWRCSFWAARCW